MKVLVTGSRTLTNGAPIRRRLVELALEVGWDQLVIVHGHNPKGADAIADSFAREFDVRYKRYPAAWKQHHPYWCPGEWCKSRGFCLRAGPRRNQHMLDVEHPDLVLAFTDKPLEKSKGTNDMVQRAIEANVRVEIKEIFAADLTTP